LIKEKLDLETEAELFFDDNPEVYRLFCQFVDEVIGRGYKKFAVAAIWERLRWEMSLTRNSQSPFIPTK
jgi:hypothetical protein